MTLEIKLPKETVVLDSEKNYSGGQDINDGEKSIRRALGLPIKKALVFYTDKRNADSVVPVETYRLVEMYTITDPWFTVEVKLKDGSLERIHSLHFIEMQKPSFVADMLAQVQPEE